MSVENNNNSQWPEPGLLDSSNAQQWPPTGNSAQASADAHVITNCPHCNRKLLSTRSIMCNWCGKRIDDPEYLERAAQERAQLDAKERTDVEQELDMTARLGVRGYIKQQAKNPLRSTPPILLPDDLKPK